MPVLSTANACRCLLTCKALSRLAMGLFLLAWFFQNTLTFIPYSLFAVSVFLALELAFMLLHTYASTPPPTRSREMFFYAIIYLVPCSFFLYWGLAPNAALLLSAFPYVMGTLLIMHGFVHTLTVILKATHAESKLSAAFIAVTACLSIPLFFMGAEILQPTLVMMLLLASLFTLFQLAANIYAPHDLPDEQGNPRHLSTDQLRQEERMRLPQPNLGPRPQGPRSAPVPDGGVQV